MSGSKQYPVNIVLEGFMGVGKTTVGKEIASLLNYRFLDVDEEVCRCAGKSIRRMLLDNELQLVREWELKVCRELSDLSGTVISTGAGVFTREENAEALGRKGFVVCLDRCFDDVYPVISADPVRIMAYGKPYGELKALLDSRTPMYHRSADLVILNDGSADEAAREIVAAYCKARIEY